MNRRVLNCTTGDLRRNSRCRMTGRPARGRASRPAAKPNSRPDMSIPSYAEGSRAAFRAGKPARPPGTDRRSAFRELLDRSAGSAGVAGARPRPRTIRARQRKNPGPKDHGVSDDVPPFTTRLGCTEASNIWLGPIRPIMRSWGSRRGTGSLFHLVTAEGLQHRGQVVGVLHARQFRAEHLAHQQQGDRLALHQGRVHVLRGHHADVLARGVPSTTTSLHPAVLLGPPPAASWSGASAEKASTGSSSTCSTVRRCSRLRATAPRRRRPRQRAGSACRRSP